MNDPCANATPSSEVLDGPSNVIPRLLGYVASHENVVTRLSSSHPVFSGVGLQRNILSFSAYGQRPLAFLVGDEGSGKTFVLSKIEELIRHAFPHLSVYVSFRVPEQSGRSRAVSFLRALWYTYGDGDEIDNMSPNELLHNAPELLKKLSAEVGGILLIIDDFDDVYGGNFPKWLPSPLPPGLHCIVSSSFGIERYMLKPEHATVFTLSPLNGFEQRQLASRCSQSQQERVLSTFSRLTSTGKQMSARTCSLVASLAVLKPDLCEMQLGDDAQAELARACLDVCSEQHGSRVLQVFLFLTFASHGLNISDLTILCCTSPELLSKHHSQDECSNDLSERTDVTPDRLLQILIVCQSVLRNTRGLYCLAGNFALRAVKELFASHGVNASELEIKVRVKLFLHFGQTAKGLTDAAEEGAVKHGIEEAAAQLSLIDHQSTHAASLSDAMQKFVICPPVMSHYASRADELITMWRKAGIRQVAENLIERLSCQSASPHDQLFAGRLLSAAGEFATARKLLELASQSLPAKETDACAGSNSSSTVQSCAEALIVFANNEVRYWDSRRDWGSVAALKLLMESSHKAVEIFKRQQPTCPAEKLLFARALSRRANACFKAGCVSEPGTESQNLYFDEADASIALAVSMVQGRHVQVLGEAILVGGVTTLCRSHSLRMQRRRHEALDSAILAMLQFYRAEANLRRSVGKINEKSIYSHGNLAELFLNDLRQPFLGLLHERQACIVAVRVLGADHANAKRKIDEVTSIFNHLGWQDFVVCLEEGRPEDVSPAGIVSRFLHFHGSFPLGGLHEESIASAFARDKDEIGGAEFWNELWRDLGVTDELAEACGLPGDFDH
eukprot:TRINITY_DN27014_c0_g1_i1.p1 TRINITY_DN27014_c0_g1~~TRINITY_DN27014_c0_g1_i1.p1  ORF type:complete len:858 (-),score=73.20 TRINITY_DN27014_c0_g1_i1:134-2671(-)